MDGNVRIIACKTIRDEVESVRGDIEAEYCDGFLHDTPDQLRQALKERVAATPEGSTVLLGYGRCSNGVVGLEAGSRRLVLPVCDDCIAMLLGSRRAYAREFADHPGTFYYTRGWIEELEDPYREYLKMIPRVGEEKARMVAHMMLESYTRVAIIDTGTYDLEMCESYVQTVSDFYDLPVAHLRGSLRLLEKLVRGPHDGEFIVVEPGEVLAEELFWALEGLEPAPETDPNPIGSACRACPLAAHS